MVEMKIIVKTQPRTNIRKAKRNGNDNYSQYNIFLLSSTKCQNPKKSASIPTIKQHSS